MNEGMYTLLAKYFSGQATAEEKHTVDVWVAASKENRDEFKSAKNLWDNTGEITFPIFDTEAAWQKIKTTIEQPPVQKRGLIKTIGFKVATAAAILLLVAGLWWLTSGRNDHKTVTADVAVKEIILDDGSHVYLRKNASLTFPDRFHKNIRDVELTGEAFFEIAKNPDKPFIISASGATVKVLGTSFTVNSNNNQVEVLVKTGLVQFSSAKDSSLNVKLEPGTRGVIKEGKLLKENFNDENFNSWQTGKLIFHNTSMQEVMRVLSLHYQVNITCKKGDEDKVLIPAVTTTFNQQPLDSVIQELELITTFHIRKVSATAYEISSL